MLKDYKTKIEKWYIVDFFKHIRIGDDTGLYSIYDIMN